MNREQIIEHYKGFFGIDRVTTEADSVLIDWAEALLEHCGVKPIVISTEEYLSTYELLDNLDETNKKLNSIIKDKTA